MHQLSLLVTLSAGFIAALSLGYLTHRIGWSPIVGYLLAGVLVGPHTPGFVADKQLADQLAEVGVILLMFGVGLHFHPKDLWAVRRVALSGTVIQSVIAAVLGAAAARGLGWSLEAGVIYGIALSVASTVVQTRVLSDHGQLQSPAGRIAVGWLIVEDLVTVFVLVLIPALLARERPARPETIILVLLKVAAFMAFVLAVGGRVIPWLLQKIAETRSREMFTLGILAAALGIAVGSSAFFGVSVALGAFLAGVVVGQSDFSARAGAEAIPLRDAFAVMFFLATGMLLDPARVIEAPGLTLLTLAAILVAKPLLALLTVALHGHGSRTALIVSTSRLQIGEFSFLLAAVGRELRVLPDAAMNALVAAAIGSIALTPLLYPAAGKLELLLQRHPRLWRLLNRRAEDLPEGTVHGGANHRAVVVGYGPTGKAVVRLLTARGIVPVVVEMNIDTHMKLRAAGIRCIHGDANQSEVLEEAGIQGAASLIVTTSGAEGAAEAIRAARQLNPGVHIISRVEFLSQSGALRRAGADDVFSGEGEVALAITDSLLRKLGATPDQLDEERARIRTELFQQTS